MQQENIPIKVGLLELLYGHTHKGKLLIAFENKVQELIEECGLPKSTKIFFQHIDNQM